MLIAVCWLVVKGLLQRQEDGALRMSDFLDEQRMDAAANGAGNVIFKKRSDFPIDSGIIPFTELAGGTTVGFILLKSCCFFVLGTIKRFFCFF